MTEQQPHASIPIQYIIETKSDWTRFSIVEDGFWWSDVEIECLKGEEKLLHDPLWNDKIILIKKTQWDESLVKAKVICKLNVQKTHLDSNIRYKIEKGDIQYTGVRIFIRGRETDYLENNERVSGNPNNPKEFSVSIKKHMKQGIRGRILSRVHTPLKIGSLFGISWAVVVGLSYAYCYGLSLDFSEFAKTNPHTLFLASLALFASLVAIASKRNWI
jgi:hypothetical protein